MPTHGATELEVLGALGLVPRLRPGPVVTWEVREALKVALIALALKVHARLGGGA